MEEEEEDEEGFDCVFRVTTRGWRQKTSFLDIVLDSSEIFLGRCGGRKAGCGSDTWRILYRGWGFEVDEIKIL